MAFPRPTAAGWPTKRWWPWRRPVAGATTLVQVLGHKADLMVILFRQSFEELAEAELAFSRCALAAHLEPSTSYVSIVELGMYEMTAKIHGQLGATLKPGSPESSRRSTARWRRRTSACPIASSRRCRRPATCASTR